MLSMAGLQLMCRQGQMAVARQEMRRSKAAELPAPVLAVCQMVKIVTESSQ